MPNPKPLPGNKLDVASEADQSLRALREKLTEAETSLATTRSDLQRAQAGLVAAGQKQAALRAALREAQSAHETERAALETMLHKAEGAHKSERATLKAALHEAQVAQRSEAALRHRLESSTAWRITWPIRRALTLFRSLPITLDALCACTTSSTAYRRSAITAALLRRKETGLQGPVSHLPRLRRW